MCLPPLHKELTMEGDLQNNRSPQVRKQWIFHEKYFLAVVQGIGLWEGWSGGGYIIIDIIYNCQHMVIILKAYEF